MLDAKFSTVSPMITDGTEQLNSTTSAGATDRWQCRAMYHTTASCSQTLTQSTEHIALCISKRLALLLGDQCCQFVLVVTYQLLRVRTRASQQAQLTLTLPSRR